MTQEIISYTFVETPFGRALIGATEKGICYIAFIKNKTEGIAELKKRFNTAAFQQKEFPLAKKVTAVFGNKKMNGTIPLDVQGTEFQQKVWKALLGIPMGDLTTYAALAKKIGKPKAVRAVGTAVGQNPIGFLIPCHRVITSSGAIGNYHWGADKKIAMIEWEMDRANKQ